MSEQLVNDPERLKPENDPQRKNYEVEAIWHALMKEVVSFRKSNISGDPVTAIPVIAISDLRKYWHKATGWMPPE